MSLDHIYLCVIEKITTLRACVIYVRTIKASFLVTIKTLNKHPLFYFAAWRKGVASVMGLII